MLKLTQRSLTLLFAVAIFTHVSNAGVMAQEKPVNLPARFAHLRHGINLSHWFSQAADYSKTHLDTHTTANDIALIKRSGFDHVRFPIEPTPLLNDTPDPSILNSTYLGYVDSALDIILADAAPDMILADGALDMILAAGLVIVIDIHPSEG